MAKKEVKIKKEVTELQQGNFCCDVDYQDYLKSLKK